MASARTGAVAAVVDTQDRMRWKLLRRRLSVSAPRVTVRSRLPWPVRWVAFAIVLGFSGALALWAFEFGKDIAGVDRNAHAELAEIRAELDRLKSEHERAVSIANSADSLLKTERVAQESLAARVKSLEAENLALTRDLGFFEKLMPSGGSSKSISLRGLQAQPEAPGRLHYQALLMLAPGRSGGFSGRYEVILSGTLEGKAWTHNTAQPTHTVNMKQYQRLEGVIDHPVTAVVKQLEIKVLDGGAKVQTSEVVRL
jgi:hypothetical protein